MTWRGQQLLEDFIKGPFKYISVGLVAMVAELLMIRRLSRARKRAKETASGATAETSPTLAEP